MKELADDISEKDDLEALLQEDVLVFGSHIIKDYEIGDYIVRAVDDVKFKINEGELLVIKGPSGAGKTTLLNLIGGLDYPTKGKLYCFGVKITDMDQETLATWRAVHSGFIFQNYNLISTLTAVENIIFPMKIIDRPLSDARKTAIKLLEKMHLEDRYEHLPFQLSAGEQQRVAIARALANDPPLIIADEPTANLDSETSTFIENVFQELKAEKRTIVIATHDKKLIQMADRIFKFKDGKIV